MLDRRNLLTAGLSVSVLALTGMRARADTPLRGDLVQGTLIRGRTDPGASVWLDGRALKLADDGNFAFGFAYDRTSAASLKIQLPDGQIEQRTIEPTKRDYDVQKINGLPGKFVEPPASVLARIKRDNQHVGAARAHDTDEAWFADDFDWPVKGRISGVYGSQRILNGVPKRPHFGVDIAAGEGTPIRAPVGAVVSMSEDLYYTGGTVILDHGRGVSTSYLHMSRVDVKVGDRLAKGDVIGAVGKTGRATGPHLCWRLNGFQERLDPALVVPEMG